MAKTISDVWKMFQHRRMWISLMMGFYSGLPLLLTGGTLKTWLAREQVDISTIGYFGWVGMAYSLKFLWSPLLDRFVPHSMGRRKSWLLIGQVGILLGLIWVGTLNPHESITVFALVALLVAFFSATQDIAVDAYRRELMETHELGMASAMYQYGYRIAMYVSGGIGISLVGTGSLDLTWNQLYFLMAAIMASGIVFTFFIPEPRVTEAHPKSLKAAVIEPFREFMSRRGALGILLFVLMFKFGDALAGAMLNPFYVQMGYSNADIGLIAKTVGLVSVLIGLFLGGLVIARLGIYRSLWVFGIFQALSTASFSLITFTGPEKWALALTVVFEDISGGMGSSAFLAFLANLTNKKFTATQFAVLSSVATLGRNFFSGFSGDMVKFLDWAGFFITCAAFAIPGLMLLLWMRKYNHSTTA